MMKKYLYAAIITFGFTIGALYSQTIIPGGPVSGTWNQEGSPYLIQGDISIDQSSSLLIEPGVNVLFQRYYRLLCEGQLIASGTETDSIIITSEDTSEGWDGIDFVDLDINTMDSSRLEYCELSYGVASRQIGGINFKHGGVLHLRNSSKVLISHCLIAHNRTVDVVGVNGANGINSNNNIPPTDGMPGENAETKDGGAIYCNNSDILIDRCVFHDNRTGDAVGGNGGNGGYHYSYSVNAHGGDGGSGGEANSGKGGGLYVIDSEMTLQNSIFINNYTGDAIGGMGGEGGFGEVFINHTYDAYGGDGADGGIAESGEGGVTFCENSSIITSNILLFQCKTGDAYGGNGGEGGYAGGFGLGEMFGGDGGDGGDCIGGEGVFIFSVGTDTKEFSQFTIVDNIIGISEEGEGGAGGEVWPSGIQGFDGYAGVHDVCEDLICGENISISNSIIRNNSDLRIPDEVSVNYCCTNLPLSGTGNIIDNPEFISTSVGDYFLSQIEAGQTVQSPCVDAGCPDSSMIVGTTRTDGVPDDGIVDMGYHYPLYETTPVLSLIPAIINFEGIVGDENPEPGFIEVLNYGGGTFNYSVSNTSNWLTISPSAGGPVPPTDTLTASVDITGMVAGTYEDTITVFSSEAINSPQIVPAYLELAGPILELSANSLTVNATIGSGNPYNQTFQILNTGIDTLFWTIEEEVDWLSVEPVNGQTPPEGEVIISFDVTGMQVGVYYGDIIVSAVGAANSPATLHVTLEIVEQLFLSGPLNGVLQGGNTYIVTDDISIAQDDSLIIQPGVTLLFDGYHSFNIHGYLSAIGTETDSIWFMSMDSTMIWTNLRFDDDCDDSSILEYCNITNTNSLYITDSSPTISKCSIFENYSSGIIASGSNSAISECNIYGNVENNEGGGIKCEYGSSIFIFGCNIYNNIAELGGGIYCDQSEITVMRTLIHNNSAEELGGGVYTEGSESAIINSTISNNTSPADGGGIYYKFSFLTLKNTIVAGNVGNEQIYFYYPISADVSYNDVYYYEGTNFGGNIPNGLGVITSTNYNGDFCDAYSNIFLEPMFIDTTSQNFHLQENSPCIDAGDPTSPFDPDNTIADIGVFYFYQYLPPIQDLIISIQDNDILLDWGDVPEAQIYYIFRSDLPYFDTTGMTPWAVTTYSEYLDMDALSNGIFYYRVVYEQ